MSSARRGCAKDSTRTLRALTAALRPPAGAEGGRPGTVAEPAPCPGVQVFTADNSAGFSVEQVVALVNRTPSLALGWDSGGVSDVSIRIAETVDGACRKDVASETTLEARIVLVVRTGDGRIQSFVPGTLAARGTSGLGLTSAAITASQTCAAGAPSSWAIACGVSAIDIAGYDGVRVDVALDVEPVGEGAGVRGTLDVFGARGGGCTGGANGTCSSPLWEPIEHASFSSE